MMFDGKNRDILIGRYTHLIWGTVLLMVILCLGTLGYHIIEGWSFIDSFYMTWITLTTVGFGEVHPLSNKARLFTIFIMFMGIGFFAYILATFSQALLEGRLKEILNKRSLVRLLKRQKKHYIVCGYGRLGRIICKELLANKVSVVVIENDPSKEEVIRLEGSLYIIGNATDEETLKAANINFAKGLISVVSSDADNVYITLTAKGLNPDIFVLSRAINESAQSKLLHAGADKVVFTEQIGARRMAQLILRPTVADFLEMATLGGGATGIMVEELTVFPKSLLCGKTLIESEIRKNLDLIIVAIKKKDGKMVFNPKSSTMIEGGDTLIAMGYKSNLMKLEEILGVS